MKNFTLLLSLFFVIIGFNVQAKTIYYVTATGTGDGSSWSNAINSIQPMIDKAVSGDEVWVAKGTYYPTTETIARDPRSATFLLKDGVNLYGGFFGTETAISQRALADLNNDSKIDSCELVNSTILSGDIDGVPDVWTKTINADGKTWVWTVKGNEGNCYNVVTGGSLDGFTVIGGNANNNASPNGGGIYSSTYVSNCTVSNCSAINGGGICSSTSTTNISNCTVSNCSASYGGGISSDDYTSYIYISNCTVSNCSAGSCGGGMSFDASTSYISNCTLSNCSAGSGGGIYSNTWTKTSYSYINCCTLSNCFASSDGGGIYISSYLYESFLTNCLVFNCSAGNRGGGILSYPSYTSNISNCTVSNCLSSYGGGIYSSDFSSNSLVTNCAVSNCSATKSGSGVDSNGGYLSYCAFSNNSTAGIIDGGFVGNSITSITPNIIITYKRPTTFIGIALSDAQRSELLTADWHLRKGSPCINHGYTQKPSSNDIDGNLRVLYGAIDIGAYEYVLPTKSMPISEKFDTISSWDTSPVFYNSASINGGLNILWTLVNQKADFSWQTNLTSTYIQPIFTYQIDGTKTSKVYLRYDMYFQAYAGTITPLGTEKLNVEFSTDLINWSTIATYSNANGTIANQTYKYDISALAAGKTFFIRFNANGANSNRIEKWEIDNVIIDADGLSAVNTVQENKYKYSINDGDLIISNLGQKSLVQLYDVNGRLISAKNSASQMLQFILPTHGVYIVKVTSDSGIENKKVVW